MTQTPSLRFATRPTPPAAGTPEYERWSQESSFTYPGGYLTSAYGNLVQTLNLAGQATACTATDKTVTVGASVVQNKIGGATINRKAFTYTKKQYNKRNSSLAAAGERVKVVTDVGSYDARMSGSIQSLVQFLCANTGLLYGPVFIYSERGTEYGPFNPVTNP